MVSSGYLGVNGYLNPAASSVYGINYPSFGLKTGKNPVQIADSFQYSPNSVQQYLKEEYLLKLKTLNLTKNY